MEQFLYRFRYQKAQKRNHRPRVGLDAIGFAPRKTNLTLYFGAYITPMPPRSKSWVSTKPVWAACI